MKAPLKRSFAGGIVTPELYSRLDLVAGQTGLAECENFEVRAHGPVSNRAGFAWVNEVRDSTKVTTVLPFIYSTSQAYVLEFGNQTLRFITAGAMVLEATKAVTGATKANPCVLTIAGHSYAVGDEVFLASIGGMTQLNGRFLRVRATPTVNTVSIEDTAGNAINSTNYTTYTSGGTAGRVYQISTPYLEADLPYLHFTQSADVLTITHPSYQQRELRRLGAASWQLATLAFTPAMATPAAPTVAASPASGTDKTRYRITAVAEDGYEESLGSAPATVSSSNITGITKASPGVLTVVGHGRAAGDTVYPSGVGGMTEINGREFYVDTTPTADTLTLKELDGTVLNTSAYTTYTSGGTLAYVDVVNTLTTAGNKNTVTLPASSGSVRQNVYKYRNGVYGYVGQTADSSFVDDNITPDMTQTVPVNSDPFVGADNYPAAVGYYQQRRWFAGTNNRKQNLYATRSGTESNMSSSLPQRDDDAITVRINSRQQNAIRHIIDSDDLLLFTSNGVWKVFAQNSDALTYSTVDPRKQSNVGASNVQPVLTSDSVLFASDRGGHVREVKLSETVGGKYVVADVSVLATHLFDGYTVKSMTWTQTPNPTAWFVRSDGVLLGLTYLPEHKVMAWHTHTTDGSFESVAAVPEGDEDVLYASIRRTFGVRTVRSVERKHTRLVLDIADSFFLDAGFTYDGSPATTITGLWVHEGREVSIVADGCVLPDQTVTNGTITLDEAASVVHVGRGYTARLKTLPLAWEGAAFGQGVNKVILQAHVRLNESAAIWAGTRDEKMYETQHRTTEPYGAPPKLISTEKSIPVDGEWNRDGQFILEARAPLPVTVLGMTLDMASG
jgi:hypothetical protein